MGLPFLGWTTSGAAEQGDFNPGGPGITTAGKTTMGGVTANSGSVAGVQVGDPQMASHAPAFWIGLVVLYFVASYFFKGKDGGWGLWSVLDTGVKAVIALAFFKWFFATVQVPGLSSVVLSA